MSAGNNAWGPLRFDLLSTDMYTSVTPNVMQELGELSKNLSFQGRFRASGGDFVRTPIIVSQTLKITYGTLSDLSSRLQPCAVMVGKSWYM